MKSSPNQLKNLKPIKKGEVRNPLGGGAHNKALKQVRRLTIQEVVAVGELILMQDLPALQKIAEEKGASVLKVWIASCAAKAIQNGDATTLNQLLDRFIGKVPTQVLLQGHMKREQPVNLDKLSKKELADLEALLTKAEAAKGSEA